MKNMQTFSGLNYCGKSLTLLWKLEDAIEETTMKQEKTSLKERLENPEGEVIRSKPMDEVDDEHVKTKVVDMADMDDMIHFNYCGRSALS